MEKNKTEDLIKGKTSTGFEYQVDKSNLYDDFDFIDMVRRADKQSESGEDPFAYLSVIEYLLGPQMEKLKDHVRTKDGFLSIKAIMSEVKEILQGPTEVKK